MSYNHLSTNERIKLECWKNLGWSVRQIGRELNRHHSTIARELQRGNLNGSYCADTAKQKYVERRKDCCPKGKYTPYPWPAD